MTGVVPTLPKIEGLPGLMAMPWTTTSPNSATAAEVKSLVPADEPAPIKTKSEVLAASEMVALIAS